MIPLIKLKAENLIKKIYFEGKRISFRINSKLNIKVTGFHNLIKAILMIYLSINDFENLDERGRNVPTKTNLHDSFTSKLIVRFEIK